MKKEKSITRQAFLIDDTPKEGEKYPCTFELSKDGSCVGSVNDRCENCENRAKNNNQPTVAKPFHAVEEGKETFTVGDMINFGNKLIRKAHGYTFQDVNINIIGRDIRDINVPRMLEEYLKNS